MATIRIDLETASGNTRQQLRDVQSQIIGINEQIARNSRLAVDAMGTERQSLQQTNTRLRADRQLLAAQRQRLNSLLPGLRDEIRATREATQATRRFSGVLNEIGGIVGGIGIAELAFHIQQFATNSVRAAAELQGFQRGLQIIEGTNAPNRLQELIEVANLPGLQLAQLINYNNRLRAIGLSAEEVDSILLTTGQTILAMGGTSDIASQAVEQLVQALQTNTVSLQDFRSIAQRIPGFYQAIAATHDVEASIDGFRVAVDNAGGSVKDALLPVMDELARRFGSPPADSYVVAIDGLQNSFFLLQAEIGNNLLPILAQAATGLSQFFDAIREGNLDELPAPIQAIVSGAQSLYNGLIQVGEAIRSGLGPELDLLLPAIGTLLGNVLELAGSLINALAPAYEILAVPTRIAISLIVHLAETLGTVIGGITDFVNWVTGAAESQEQLRTSTQQTAQVMMSTATATQQAADSTENLQGTLQTLQSDLSSVNERLAEKRQRYDELVRNGANPAHASLQQLDRQITGLEADAARLTGEINNLTTSTESSATATDTATQSTKDLAVEVRILTEIYNDLASNVQQANEQFDLVQQSGFADFYRLVRGEIEAYGGALDTVIPSVTDAEREQQAFNAAVQSGIDTTKEIVGDPLADYIDGLGLTSEAADGATSAITDNNAATREFTGDIDRASERLRDFQGGVENTKRSHIDFTDVVDRQARPAVEDLTTATDEAAQKAEEADAAFRAIDASLQSVSGSFRITGQSLGDIGDELVEVTEALRDKKISAEEAAEVTEALFQQASLPNNLQREIQNVLDDLQDMEISAEDAEDSVGLLIDAFETFGHDGTLGVNQIIGAFDTLAESLIDTEGLIGDVGVGIQGLVGLFSSPIGFAAGTLGAVIEGLSTLEDFAGPLGLGDDFFTDPTPGSEVIRGGQSLDDARYQDFVDIVLGRRGGYEDPIQFLLDNAPGLIEEFRPRIDTDPRLSSVYNRLFPQQTGPISSFTRSPDFDVDAEYAATFAPGDPTPTLGVTPTAPAELPPLDTVFDLTSEQRGILAPLEEAVEIAQGVVDDLNESSTPEEIATAYTNLANAEEAVHNRIIGFIRNATNITEDARGRAERLQNQRFGNEIERANGDLIDALGLVGLEVVGGITNMSEIVRGSALRFQQIPQEVMQAVEEATPDAAEATPLRTTFRFTGEQQTELDTLEGDVEEAEDTLNRLRRDDTATPFQLVEAYNNLIAAEQALYDQEIAFINEGVGVFTDSALQAERTQAGQRFRGEIFDANVDLTKGLENIGLQLTDTITDWFAILTITALDIQRIPDPVVPEPETPEPSAAEEAQAEPLREEFRFTGAQSTRLGTLRGDVEEAEDTLNRLRRDDTATPEQLTEAYNNLIAAEQALFDQEIAFIDAGAGIFTESALEEERTQARQRFRGEIFDANVDLTRGLENLGLQLTTTITDWFMILTGAQLAVEAIPEPEVPETPDAPAPLRERHRFSAAEQTRLGILETDVRAAEDAVGLLDESSTEAEITEAYTNLANAEQALYQQKLAFIDGATGITETARQDARELAEGIFGREIFDANQRLVRSLGNIGLELVTMFDATTGILMGTALTTQQIAQETVDAGTETQTDSDDGIGNNLLENAIARARFRLTGATTEQEFETARQDLIRAINAYYDAEETRINMLMLSEEELQDLREDNDLARDQALRRATNATNTFAEDRINTAEREQREIEGLRDDAFENERNRKQRLVDLEQDTQNRILDIQRDANRSREDIERDFQRDYQEIRSQLTFGEITQEEATSRLQALGRQRLEDLEDLGIRTGRRREDVGIRQERSEADINAQATATATAIREVLTPLLTGQEMSPSEMAMDAAMTPPAEASAMTVENTGTTAEKHNRN